jgi:integrase
MSRFVPDKEQYKETLAKISGDLRTTVVVRLMSECGMAREEVVNLTRDNTNRFHNRGIWIEKAKSINKGKKKDKKVVYEMRSREVPINAGLYTLLIAYIGSHTSPFLIDRLRHSKVPKPLTPRMVNTIFANADIKWSPHDCRHFFRAQVRKQMIKERSIDTQVIKEIMGHVLDVHEKYGGESDFEYKLEIVDKVF